MGEYLSSPMKEKNSEDGECAQVGFLKLTEQVKFGASSM